MDSIYDMGNYSNMPPNYFMIKHQEKKTLKKLGLLCGSGFLFYILVQQILVIIIQLTGLMDIYSSNGIFQSCVDVFLTFISVLLPFSLVNRKMKKVSGVGEAVAYDRTVSKGTVVLAVIAGVGLCMAANIVSSYFVAIASLFGYELSSVDIPMPTGVTGITISFIRVVITAAMAEEISLRGYVMGNLRKYGDAFAISMASIIFAIMHGNLIQSPFALIAGFIMGYFCLKTGSVWTAILIHASNNGISLLVTYLLKYLDEESATLIHYFILFSLIIAGTVCFIIFHIKTKGKKLEKSQSILTTGEKVGAFMLNPAMLISVLFMLYVTSTYIN